jgi:hypothetical protein
MRWVSYFTYTDTCGEITEYLGSMARQGAPGPFPRRTLERRLLGSIRKNSQCSTEYHTIELFEIDRASAIFCSESIKTTILEADCPVINMTDTFYSVINKSIFEHIWNYTASQTTSDLRQMNEVHLGLPGAS